MRRFVEFFERVFFRFIKGRFLCHVAAVLGGFASVANATTAAYAAEVNRQFTLSAGTGVCFSYPLTGSNAPVHIMVSVSLANGSSLLPSPLVSAVVNRDTKSGKFSSIAMNGDGTTSASGAGGPAGIILAVGAESTFYLVPCPIAGKSNQLELYQTNTVSKFNYYVTMFY